MKKMQITILVISVILLVVGIIWGDLGNSIYQKAIKLCLECIGIG
ncbi:MAG: thioredoxin [Spirochaetes bacterium]|nr:thioredoxin [Spirochaetota bacterium]